MCVLILFMYKAKEFLKNHRIRGGAVYLVTILTLYTVSFIRFIGFGQYTTILSLSLSSPYTNTFNEQTRHFFVISFLHCKKRGGRRKKNTKPGAVNNKEKKN